MITAIIVNYQLAHSVIHGVRALLDDAVGQDMEVWVIDNSECEEQAAALRGSLGETCRLVVNERNVGFGAACNQAYRAARGEWVLLLNPDAYLEAGALAAMSDCLARNRSVGAVGPLVYWDEARTFLLPPSILPSPWHGLLGLPFAGLGPVLTWVSSLHWRAGAIRYWKATRPLRQRNLSGGHVLLRRAAVDEAGGLFDPRFFLYFEDTDLFLRMRRAGYRLCYLPQARAVHAFSGCAPAREPWKREQMQRAHGQFMEKHYRARQRHVGRLASRSRVPRWRPRITDLGNLAEAPDFPVRQSWREGWLMEWSPSPYFFPAAGYFGAGGEAVFPASAWSILPPGESFVRLGSASRFWVSPEIWRWETRDR